MLCTGVAPVRALYICMCQRVGSSHGVSCKQHDAASKLQLRPSAASWYCVSQYLKSAYEVAVTCKVRRHLSTKINAFADGYEALENGAKGKVGKSSVFVPVSKQT